MKQQIFLKISFFILAFSFFTFYACDKIEAPYEKKTIIKPEDTLSTAKVLLEEFTGHKCVNCPEGAALAHQIEALYPNKFYIVSIHAGDFARPSKTGDKYLYDFRTTVGEELNGSYNVTSYPTGMVNRANYEGNTVLNTSAWSNAVSKIFNDNKKPEVSIKITAQYSAATRKIETQVNLEYLTAQTTTNKLSVWILEDSIVNWQKSKDTPYDIQNYVHNNVLRYSFNSTWGDVVSETAIPTGFKFDRKYSYNLEENSDWKPNKLNVIAFVHDEKNGIKQVEKVTVKVQ